MSDAEFEELKQKQNIAWQVLGEMDKARDRHSFEVWQPIYDAVQAEEKRREFEKFEAKIRAEIEAERSRPVMDS